MTFHDHFLHSAAATCAQSSKPSFKNQKAQDEARQQWRMPDSHQAAILRNSMAKWVHQTCWIILRVDDPTSYHIWPPKSLQWTFWTSCQIFHRKLQQDVGKKHKIHHPRSSLSFSFPNSVRQLIAWLTAVSPAVAATHPLLTSMQRHSNWPFCLFPHESKAVENGHRNSEFFHEKWWFSIVMGQFTRG